MCLSLLLSKQIATWITFADTRSAVCVFRWVLMAESIHHCVRTANIEASRGDDGPPQISHPSSDTVWEEWRIGGSVGGKWYGQTPMRRRSLMAKYWASAMRTAISRQSTRVTLPLV